MLAYVADEVKEAEILHPVIVVDHLGCVWRIGVEVEEFGKLVLDCLLIVAEGFFVEKLALLALHGGVADHACGAAYKRDGLVTCALEVFEHHDAHKVADVERVSRRVNAEVGCGHFFLKLLVGAGHHLMDHAAP